MALLLNMDGTHGAVYPKNGTKFGIHEIQDALFGDLREDLRRQILIKDIPTNDGRFMLVDEEGEIRNLAPNRKAALYLGPPNIGTKVYGPTLIVFRDEWV